MSEHDETLSHIVNTRFCTSSSFCDEKSLFSIVAEKNAYIATRIPVLATWDISSKKKPFGLSSSASFSLSGGTQPSIQEANPSHPQGNTRRFGQLTLTKGMHRRQERAAKNHLRHDATNWRDFVPQLSSRICSTASGCPAVVMVQSTHDWTSDHLLACVTRGKS